MPRIKRRVSSTGVYHVMIKGIDDRNIFLNDYDRKMFMKILKEATKKEDTKIFLYCLMNNHVHLLLENQVNLGAFMKRISEIYSKYHNSKYGRIGHLFQNRYKSEVVENESHLKTLFTYIHNNSVKAGIVENPQQYKWSSCKIYLHNKTNDHWLDTGLYHKLFTSQDEMIHFMFDYHLIYKPSWMIKKRWSDDELTEIVSMLKSAINTDELIINDMFIQELRIRTGAPYKQMGRVLGISTNLIQKACNSNQIEY